MEENNHENQNMSKISESYYQVKSKNLSNRKASPLY
jgi:hypothetical protein